MATKPTKPKTPRKPAAAKPRTAKPIQPLAPRATTSTATARPTSAATALRAVAASATAQMDAEKAEKKDAAGDMLKKPDLIDKVVLKSGVKKKFVKPTVEALLEVLSDELNRETVMNLPPLGKIKVSNSKDLDGAKLLIARIRQNKK